VGREDSAPKSDIVADADALSIAEGSIWTTAKARSLGAAGVPARGTLLQGFAKNLGDLAVSSCKVRFQKEAGAIGASSHLIRRSPTGPAVQVVTDVEEIVAFNTTVYLSAERFLGDFLLSKAIRDAPAAGILAAPLSIISVELSFFP
jgi:hypothetical protein